MNSNGIDYFSFNVDFFNDDKLQLIEAEFGIKGSYIAVRLLCKIYHEGYYYQWGDDECLLFTKNIGNGIVSNTVKEVLAGLVKRSFFDKGVFDQFTVLTSAGIQRRYFEAVKRRQSVEARAELLLIDVSKYSNVYIINKNVSINSENDDIPEQSKRKESKGKEKKEKEYPPLSPMAPSGADEENIISSLKQDGIRRNLEGLVNAMKTLAIPQNEQDEIMELSNHGEIGNPIWKLINQCMASTNKPAWDKSKIKIPGRFIIKKLKE